MRLRDLLLAVVLISGPLPLSAIEPANDSGRQEGVALLLSARDAYQGLNSYRCRFRANETAEYLLAYSGANYRIETIKDGQNEALRTFDGETYSSLSLKNFFMYRGTRGPCAVPMTESPLNICYGLHDVALDHYHSQDFLEKLQPFVISSEPSEFRGMPCLKLNCMTKSKRDFCIWISKEYYGFPVVTEIYGNGAIDERREVLDFEIITSATQGGDA